MKKLVFNSNNELFILVDSDKDGKVVSPKTVQYRELGRIKNLEPRHYLEVMGGDDADVAKVLFVELLNEHGFDLNEGCCSFDEINYETTFYNPILYQIL